MSQDGYTLAEALAALIMVGLAAGGLVFGVQVLGRLQGKAAAEVATSDDRSRLETAFARFLDKEGPFRSDDVRGLQGDTDRLSFPCGDKTCSATLDRADGTTTLVLAGRNETARLAVGSRGAYAFVYQDDAGAEPAWPPTARRAPMGLRAIAVTKLQLGEERPLAEARLYAEQPAVCAFDSISRTCRTEVTP
jgi:hypothetical protein